MFVYITLIIQVFFQTNMEGKNDTAEAVTNISPIFVRLVALPGRQYDYSFPISQEAGSKKLEKLREC